MSEKARRFPAGQSALRAWLLIAGVFVGAIMAMTASWAFSWGVLAPTPEEQARAAAEKREAAFHSPPGSCLTWTKPDASDVRKVRCTKQHLFEVVGTADIADRYPRGAKPPDDEAWRTITERRCGETAREYLGTPLDPHGKLTVGTLRPTAEDWAAGKRKLHCGLQWTGPGGTPQTLIGLAEDQNQSNVWPPGTCFALVDKAVGDPVPCTKEHSYEVIGLVDLTSEFENYPSKEDQERWLDRRCNTIARTYTGGADLADKGLAVTWDQREKVSWQAGSTQVNCKVGALLDDGSGLAAVRGSVRKGAQESKPPQQSGQQDPGSEQTSPPLSGESDGG